MSGVRVQNPELMALGLTLPGFIERKKVIASLPSLGLLTLAGMTDQAVNVSYLELEDFSAQDSLPGEFDMVAISSFSAQIKQAYQMAQEYRKQGTLVVLGGLHVTACAEEALQYADVVVLGEGENSWPELIYDLQHKQLKSVYDGRSQSFDLSQSPMPRYDLLTIEKYNRLTVQTQRGCPFRCEFCASSIRLSPQFKTKPVDLVIKEIEYIKLLWHKPFIELADDNSFANKRHARSLITAIAKQDVKWFTETDISIARDTELLDRLADSGCRQLLIGFESPTTSGLHGVELKTNWKERQIDFYYQAIEKIQSRGISVNGCFVLGLDGDDVSVFDKVFEFVESSNLTEVQITVQTPFAGTELYQRLRNSNRLLDSTNWESCTLFDVNFIPEQMTENELKTGFYSLMEQLYTTNRVAKRKRYFGHLKKNFLRQQRKSGAQ